MNKTNNKYIPQPIDVSDVELPRDLVALTEVVARNAHDLWAEERINEGWTYGEKRDDDNKKHPDLVPYEELDLEQSYDRKTAIGSLKAIHKLGFAIHKVPKGKIMLIGHYGKPFVNKVTKLADEKYDLDVELYGTLDSAVKYLRSSISEWHAIVFDYKADENDINNEMLRDAIDSLNEIFHKTYNEIPWYICPSSTKDIGPMDRLLINMSVGKSRRKKIDRWGEFLYEYVGDAKKKDACARELLCNIDNARQNIRNYRMRLMYEEVFDTIDAYFDNPAQTKDLLFSVLLPLHYPEVFRSFKPTDFANNLRQVLEATLLVFINEHFIPDFWKNNKGVTVPSILSHGEPNLGYSASHLQNASWCSKYIGDNISIIKDNLNQGSHVVENLAEMGLYHTITSYAQQMADVIVWIGNFIEKTKAQMLQYEGRSFQVKLDKEGHPYCDDGSGVKCMLHDAVKFKLKATPTLTVTLNNVCINNNEKNIDYLFYANFT